MSYEPFYIKVDGEIIATDRKHFAQGFACRGISEIEPNNSCYYIYERKTHTVRSNLILDHTRRAVPYAYYFTERGVSVRKPGEIIVHPGYLPAFYYYEDNIKQISTFLELSNAISTELLQPLYQGLFIDVFSTLELFLSDLLLCLIYSNNMIYENAVFYLLDQHKMKEHALEQDISKIEVCIHHFFFEEVIYHRFDKIKTLFERIVGIKEFPNYKQIKEYLHKRNNIVHRYSFSNIDRMQMSILKKEYISDLIEETNIFVKDLIVIIEKQRTINSTRR